MLSKGKQGGRNRVLIIDDDPMVLESLDMLFSHYGWDVLTAEDGDSVIDALRPIDYQLAVVDQRMDGTSGIDTIRELKLRSSAPIFMLTGCVDPGLRGEAERVGVDRFFDKPVEAAEMIRALENL
ncbi:response regulator [Pelagicoccus sp. SDUM812002]|uniref:response regulator n=1 Tax=Pelagicoccus sp. SDUM812002 TaxID=3041266 RepID=UPI00281026F5|nr:response regulator [Pelagicoccus sp. SDUM812002]MDQ8186589.1 response regulator [Pelagicoccus sp. SDUM812002]